MTIKEEMDRERRNKMIAESKGWTDLHGGLADGGAYLRGRPPGAHPSALCLAVPDFVAEVENRRDEDGKLLVETAEILTRRGICDPHE